MKKAVLTTPLVLLFSFFGFIANLEAAGCNSHKNKNVKVECSLSDENCDNEKADKTFKKVDA